MSPTAPPRSSSPLIRSSFRLVKRDLLVPNPWNPNRMTAAVYAKALESIELYGFIDPLTVRLDTDYNFQIIDGEHRFRAGCDLGMTEFPCFVIEGLADADAKKLTIVMNELRGQADPDRMGDLLADILKDRTIDELLHALPYDEGIVAGFLKQELPPLPPLAAPPTPAAGGPQPVWVERLYRLPKEAALVVDEALEKAKDGQEVEGWQALERIAADYLAS